MLKRINHIGVRRGVVGRDGLVGGHSLCESPAAARRACWVGVVSEQELGTDDNRWDHWVPRGFGGCLRGLTSNLKQWETMG